MVFMGEEWGASYAVGVLLRRSRTRSSPRRSGAAGGAEFAAHGWAERDVPDPQDPATRDRSVLDWSEVAEPEHARMLRWYAALVAERHRHPDLTDDRFDSLAVETGDGDAWLVLSRGPLRVVANLVADPADIPVAGLGPESEVVLAWDEAGTSHTGGVLHLPGHSVAIVRLY